MNNCTLHNTSSTDIISIDEKKLMTKVCTLFLSEKHFRKTKINMENGFLLRLKNNTEDLKSQEEEKLSLPYFAREKKIRCMLESLMN